MQTASPLRELTCHMVAHSVDCHPAEVTFRNSLPVALRDKDISERIRGVFTHNALYKSTFYSHEQFKRLFKTLWFM